MKIAVLREDRSESILIRAAAHAHRWASTGVLALEGCNAAAICLYVGRDHDPTPWRCFCEERPTHEAMPTSQFGATTRHGFRQCSNCQGRARRRSGTSGVTSPCMSIACRLETHRSNSCFCTAWEATAGSCWGLAQRTGRSFVR